MKNLIKGLILGVIITTLLMSTTFGGQIKKTIEVVYNSVNLTVNGNKIIADNILYNGTTYVPIRAVAEALGKYVDWDQKTYTASINDNKIIKPIDKTTVVKKKFDISEVKLGNLIIAESTLADAKKEYGNPNKAEYTFIDEDGEYDPIYSLFYGDMRLDFIHTNGSKNEEDFILSDYYLFSNKYSGPRQIKVGDSVKNVLMNFPDDNNPIVNYDFKRLYGSEYEHKGTIYYDNNKNIKSINFIYYIDTSYGYEMAIGITKDKVSEIWVRLIY